jgi:hypothetical protein
MLTDKLRIPAARKQGSRAAKESTAAQVHGKECRAQRAYFPRVNCKRAGVCKVAETSANHPRDCGTNAAGMVLRKRILI